MAKGDYLHLHIEDAQVADPDLRGVADALGAARVLVRDLRQFRERAELTQADLARRLGTTQSAIARLEAGERDPRLSTIVKYAASVGATLDWSGPPANWNPPDGWTGARTAVAPQL